MNGTKVVKEVDFLRGFFTKIGGKIIKSPYMSHKDAYLAKNPLLANEGFPRGDSTGSGVMIRLDVDCDDGVGAQDSTQGYLDSCGDGVALSDGDVGVDFDVTLHEKRVAVAARAQVVEILNPGYTHDGTAEALECFGRE